MEGSILCNQLMTVGGTVIGLLYKPRWPPRQLGQAALDSAHTARAWNTYHPRQTCLIKNTYLQASIGETFLLFSLLTHIHSSQLDNSQIHFPRSLQTSTKNMIECV
jgi:hypothetical protein